MSCDVLAIAGVSWQAFRFRFRLQHGCPQAARLRSIEAVTKGLHACTWLCLLELCLYASLASLRTVCRALRGLVGLTLQRRDLWETCRRASCPYAVSTTGLAALTAIHATCGLLRFRSHLPRYAPLAAAGLMQAVVRSTSDRGASRDCS